MVDTTELSTLCLRKARVYLLEADSTVQQLLPAECVDLIVTSPPYNIGKAYNGNPNADLLAYNDYLDFSRCWLANCLHWAQPTGRLCVNVAMDINSGGKHPLCADITHAAIDVGWQYHTTISWNEGNISRRTAWGSWMSASAPHVINPTETIIVFYKDEWKRASDGRPRENDITREEFKNWTYGSWSFPGANKKASHGHEAAYPIELPKRCIKLFSFVGDHILDPFSGSGTTLQAAFENNRKAIGIEQELKWCRATLERLNKKCQLRLKSLSPEVNLPAAVHDCWRSIPQPQQQSLFKT